MNGIMGWMERYFIPIASKIGAQRHLVAVRDGFVAIMPLIIIGSFAILFNNFPVDTFQNFMANLFGNEWTALGGNIWDGSFAILTVLVVASISFNLAKSYGVDGLSASLIAISAYIILTPTTDDWGLSYAWTGAQGLFVGVVSALVVTEIFRLLYQSKLTIKMPEGVPEGVVKSFRALIPAAIILIAISSLQLFIATITGGSLHELVFTIIQEPLQALGNTLPAAIIISFFNHLLWFFGLHGTNILGPIIESIYLPLLEVNIQQFAEGVSAHDVPYIVTKPFLDAFVFMGGSGTTLALIAGIFLVSASKHYRTIGKLSAPAGAFNINEPVLFGLPIVLNPVMLIPFVLIPVLLTITSYLAIVIGFVPKTVAMVPWTTPPIISGYLVTGGSFTGVFLQLFNLTLATLLYVPFIRASERAEEKKQKILKNKGEDNDEHGKSKIS
ncbi:PTS sugar transporter subunit IIC [Salipaludibacillus agaradhaerens]|jgi:PTS system cellobiose-specific IIC component|uniref:Permease IIC component n=1 Tax=Salipaludibacillus agaradhaerens TaxID=76935 RepID=A0A9Q4AZ59_SALAG|nr:PTS sugar transporter subunit IIC [Salipaludibacillus agaradhaerens]MCR6095096.1 PTS sugar transporter subunit IIC [Salipaludibacillus agaradhaerens]MCR6115346.1 PTS sugar transporter subunit IIC [Salipaludibacillus agaradhaerens]